MDLLSTSWMPRFVLNMVAKEGTQNQHLLSTYYVPDNHDGRGRNMSSVQEAVGRTIVFRHMGLNPDTLRFNTIQSLSYPLYG